MFELKHWVIIWVLLIFTQNTIFAIASSTNVDILVTQSFWFFITNFSLLTLEAYVRFHNFAMRICIIICFSEPKPQSLDTSCLCTQSLNWFALLYFSIKLVICAAMSSIYRISTHFTQICYFCYELQFIVLLFLTIYQLLCS